jgi:metallo-beta-lactamase class B
MVYADSLNAVSEDGFSFARKSGSETTGSALGRSIELVSALPCDVLLAPHPGFARMDEKFDHLVAGDARAFIDPSACKRYADAARKRLDERLQSDLAAERAELSREGPKR